MSFTLDHMRRDDWARVRALYVEGLATGIAAFLSTPPRWEEWDKGHLALGRLVARSAADTMDADTIKGWAALAPVPDT